MLRLSKFNFLVAVDGVSENWLLYNALTETALLIDSSLARELSGALTRTDTRKLFWRYKKNSDSDIRLEKFAESLESRTKSELSGLAILVDSRKEELCIKGIVDKFLHPSCLKLTVSYSARCQMACGYCFQSGRNDSLRHDQHLIDRTVAWAEEYIQKKDLKAIYLGLFGGEPLMDVDLGITYAQRFNELCERLSIPLEIGLTTNGLNLSKEILLRLRSYGSTSICVTLDGPPRIHDLRRPDISGAGTFEKIVNNLKKSKEIDGFTIGIAVNVDDATAASIEELLDILRAEELDEDVEIILEPLVPLFSQKSRGTFNQDQAMNNLAHTYLKVIEKQLSSPLLPGMCGSCNVTQENSFIVDWRGDLFRCSFTMLDESISCGSVLTGLSSVNLAAESGRKKNFFSANKVLTYCQEKQCPYLRFCGGGCRFQAWLTDGDWAAPNCPESIFDQVAPYAFAHSFDLKTRGC